MAAGGAKPVLLQIGKSIAETLKSHQPTRQSIAELLDEAYSPHEAKKKAETLLEDASEGECSFWFQAKGEIEYAVATLKARVTQWKGKVMRLAKDCKFADGQVI